MVRAAGSGPGIQEAPLLHRTELGASQASGCYRIQLHLLSGGTAVNCLNAACWEFLGCCPPRRPTASSRPAAAPTHQRSWHAVACPCLPAADLMLFTIIADISILTLNLSLMLNTVSFYQVRRRKRCAALLLGASCLWYHRRCTQPASHPACSCSPPLRPSPLRPPPCPALNPPPCWPLLCCCLPPLPCSRS